MMLFLYGCGGIKIFEEVCIFQGTETITMIVSKNQKLLIKCKFNHYEGALIIPKQERVTEALKDFQMGEVISVRVEYEAEYQMISLQVTSLSSGKHAMLYQRTIAERTF